MPARIKSLEEANGMLVLVGNHVNVSQLRVAGVPKARRRNNDKTRERALRTSHRRRVAARWCSRSVWYARAHGYRGAPRECNLNQMRRLIGRGRRASG